MKTAELSGAVLDFWVAKAEGLPIEAVRRGGVIIGTTPNRYVFAPSLDWARGGPIIERERIMLDVEKDDGSYFWMAAIYGKGHDFHAHAETPLVAAMRAFVASKFGHEVPDTP